MKTLAVAVLAALSLGGCVVAPAYPDAAYYPGPGYYPAPAVGVYAAPPPVVFYGGWGGGRHHRHWR